MTAQYESPSFIGAGALLNSQDGTSYLDKMSQLNLLTAHRGTLIAELNTAKGKADAAQRIATTLLTQANAQLTDLGKQRDTLLAQHNKLQATLAKFTLAGDPHPPYTPWARSRITTPVSSSMTRRQRADQKHELAVVDLDRGLVERRAGVGG